MECIVSSLNPGEAAPADGSPGPHEDVLPVEEDNFQCTFFRQPKHKSTSENPALINSSDSEVEFDDPKITTEWIETSSINSDISYLYDNQISQQDNKVPDSPKVTFGQTYVRSDNTTKLQLEKESTKPKVIQPTNEKKNATNKSYEKDKLFLVKCVNNDRYTRAFPDQRYTVYGTKRSHNFPNNANETAGKRRKMSENRAIKNKRLLKSVENVIHTLSEQESIKPSYKVAETNLVKTEPGKEQNQSQKTVADNPQTDEPEMRRPIFKKPELEKFLDESMRRAVKMYRTCRNTWNGIEQEKLGKFEHFPETNVPISRLSRTVL